MPKSDAGASRRILLVEDHPVERAYLQNMLLALGYRRVAGVGSSAEAIGALARQAYDVVISDIVMGAVSYTHLHEARDHPVLDRGFPAVRGVSEETRHQVMRREVLAGEEKLVFDRHLGR